MDPKNEIKVLRGMVKAMMNAICDSELNYMYENGWAFSCLVCKHHNGKSCLKDNNPKHGENGDFDPSDICDWYFDFARFEDPE